VSGSLLGEVEETGLDPLFLDAAFLTKCVEDLRDLVAEGVRRGVGGGSSPSLETSRPGPRTLKVGLVGALRLVPWSPTSFGQVAKEVKTKEVRGEVACRLCKLGF
jgi:hypothetical protein